MVRNFHPAPHVNLAFWPCMVKINPWISRWREESGELSEVILSVWSLFTWNWRSYILSIFILVFLSPTNINHLKLILHQHTNKAFNPNPNSNNHPPLLRHLQLPPLPINMQFTAFLTTVLIILPILATPSAESLRLSKLTVLVAKGSPFPENATRRSPAEQAPKSLMARQDICGCATESDIGLECCCKECSICVDAFCCNDSCGMTYKMGMCNGICCKCSIFYVPCWKWKDGF